jgi:predicted ribosome quality control (RQC) complex YloA/Tae2 family protein
MAPFIQKMSNLDYFFLSQELAPLVGGYINKIFELDENLFRFKIRSDKEYNFIAELGLRAHLSKYVQESPETPSNFTMLLRKYLDNAKIMEIKQENDDRLLIFTLQRGDEYHLIFEMFAKGNLILTSADYTIIGAYKSEQSKTRSIKKMETYIALPNTFKLTEKFEKQPTVYFDKENPIAFSPAKSEKFANYEKKTFNSISEMADEYYFKAKLLKETEIETNQSPKENASLKKLEHTLAQQQDALKKFNLEIDQYQKEGNYVYGNFEKIDEILKIVADLKNQKKKEEEIVSEVNKKFNLKAELSRGKLTINA